MPGLHKYPDFVTSLTRPFQGKELKTYKRQAITAAIELGYGDDVVTKIRNAENEYQVQRIMTEARHTVLDE